MNLKSLPKHFKKDKEIVLAAVKNDGFAIADADRKFLDEKEIAKAKSEIYLGLKKNGIAIINSDNIWKQFFNKNVFCVT